MSRTLILEWRFLHFDMSVFLYQTTCPFCLECSLCCCPRNVHCPSWTGELLSPGLMLRLFCTVPCLFGRSFSFIVFLIVLYTTFSSVLCLGVDQFLSQDTGCEMTIDVHWRSFWVSHTWRRAVAVCQFHSFPNSSRISFPASFFFLSFVFWN